MTKLDVSVLVGYSDVGESTRSERRQQLASRIQADGPSTVVVVDPNSDAE